MTDDDDLADKYLLAEQRLGAAGLSAYEVSNWSTGLATRAGTTSPTGAVTTGGASGPGPQPRRRGALVERQAPGRVRRPDRRAAFSPAYAREVLWRGGARVERVLLELRLADGLDTALLTAE
jgi:oxygen-independent coproporphyrinogen-3 oxidase